MALAVATADDVSNDVTMSAAGGYCCKSPISNKPKNLAEVDLRATLSLRRFSTPLRRRVIDFG